MRPPSSPTRCLRPCHRLTVPRRGRARHAVWAWLALAGWAALRFSPAQAQAPRDPWRRPFAADSIWNQAIGSGAVYAPAGLGAPDSFDPDPEYFAQVNPGDPARPIFNPATFGAPYGSTGPYRSDGTDPAWTTVYHIPLQVPDGFLVPDVDYSLTHYQTPNDCATFRQPDGSALAQFEPTTRLRAAGPLWGIPQLWDAAGSGLFADGRRGTHYGSGLSAIGGSIRAGEFASGVPLRHTLKVELSFARLFAGGGDGGNIHATYRWPATNSDGGGDAAPYSGANPALKMGSLLALPPDATEAGVGGLATGAGRQLFHAFQDYGAYVVDTSGTGGNPVNLCVEQGAQAEVPEGWAKDGSFYADAAKIFARLRVVDNNAPGSVGGGGTPRQPSVPAFRYGGQAAGMLHPLPGRVAAADYDAGGEGVGYHDSDAAQRGNQFDGNNYRNDGADVRRCREGGYQVGWTEAGEWLAYGVQAPAAGGAYPALFRVANGGAAPGALHLEDESGANLSGSVPVAPTGGADAFVTILAPGPVELGPGAHTLKVVVDAGGFELAWFQLGNPAASSAYGSWLAAHFTDAERADTRVFGPGADPNADGIPNLLAYALGLDPKKGGSRLPASALRRIGGLDYATLTIVRSQDTADAALGAQVSGDLRTWDGSAAAVETVVQADTPASGLDTVTFRDRTPLPPGGNGSGRFLRLTARPNSPW